MSLILTDLDNDSLKIRGAGGFVEPMLSVFVTQEGDTSGMLLTRDTAEQLRDFLNKFIEECDGDRTGKEHPSGQPVESPG